VELAVGCVHLRLEAGEAILDVVEDLPDGGPAGLDRLLPARQLLEDGGDADLDWWCGC
jgi:hypothetical protein